MQRGGETYYYHFDGLGSVTALTNSTGETVETYTYDAYGQPNTTSAIGNPYMFTGRRHDSETGLYYYRARYYNPLIGKFLSVDPIGYYDSMNLYSYVNNNPVNWVDPFGLCKGEKAWWEKLGGTIGIKLGLGGGALFSSGISVVPTVSYSPEQGIEVGIQFTVSYGMEAWGHAGADIGLQFTNARTLTELEGWGGAIGGSARFGPIAAFGEYIVSEEPATPDGRHVHGVEFGWAPGIGTEAHGRRTRTWVFKFWP